MFKNYKMVAIIAVSAVVVCALGFGVIMANTSIQSQDDTVPHTETTLTTEETSETDPSVSNTETNASTLTSAQTTATTTSSVAVSSTSKKQTTTTTVEYVPSSKIAGQADEVYGKSTSGKTQTLTTADTTAQKYETTQVTPIQLPTATSPGVVYDEKEVSRPTNTTASEEVVVDEDLPASFEESNDEVEEDVGIPLEDVDVVPDWLMP